MRIHWLLVGSLLPAFGCGDDGGGAPPDRDPPTIVQRTPLPGAQDVWIGAAITVVFSEPVVLGDPNAILVEDTTGGNPVTREVALSGDGTVLTIRVTGGGTSPGDLRVSLGAIADAAGNALVDDPWSFRLPLWNRPGALNLDPTAYGFRAAVEVDADGNTYVAWAENGGERARILVRRLGPAGDGFLGEPLGSPAMMQVPTVDLARDDEGRLLVTWHEGATDATSVVQVARFEDGAWMLLPSPGPGAWPGLAIDRDGNPVVAWLSIGATADPAGVIRVSRLSGDAFGTPSDIPVPGYGSLGQPVDVVVDADDRVVVAAPLSSPFGAAGSVIKVGAVAGGNAGSSLPDLLMHAGGTAWFPSLAVGPSGRVVAAWSELSGEGNDAYVAELEEGGTAGAAWRPLGHALDHEPLADATRPGLAVGAGGTLFVVWHEQHGRRSRYHLARFSGSAWEIVGGEDAGGGDAIGAGRPRLTVHGELPLVVWHEGQPGQIRLARYNGRVEPLFGLEGPIAASPCHFDPTTTTTLSSTGCFTMLGAMPEAAPGMIPFELNTPLWSDGASKRRWIVLPPGTQIVGNPTGAWTLPAGAMVVKEFSLDMTAGDPTSRRPVETRFLLWNGSEVQGFSLQWDDAGSDATLLPGDAPVTRDWFIEGAGAHTHFYPSRAQCTTCHNPVAGFFLGLQTGNVNRNVDYDGVTDNALRAMTHAGILEVASGQAPARFAPPHDFTATPYDRVRSYLTANCSQCHRPGGLRPTRDFRWETPLADTHICEGEVVLGDPDASLIFQRISTRPGMPPIATLIPDPFALSMFREWIAGMTSCP